MDATCAIQASIHVFSLVRKYVSRILGTYQIGMLWFLLALFWGSIIVQLVLESKKTEIYLLI